MLRSAANPPPVDTMHCQMYLSNGSGGRINGTAMIGGTLLHGGIMNGTLVHGRRKDEEAMITATVLAFWARELELVLQWRSAAGHVALVSLCRLEFIIHSCQLSWKKNGPMRGIWRWHLEAYARHLEAALASNKRLMQCRHCGARKQTIVT